jgi:hypothetical protein
MPQIAGMESKSKRPGTYHRPRPLPASEFEITEMPVGDNEPTLWWDRAGRLYFDRELTDATDLRIVRQR